MAALTTTWGEEVARRRIARARERGSASLWLEGLGLAEIPEDVRQLRSLRSLHLGGNQLGQLPDWLPELTGLRQLKLPDNSLRRLPEWIGELGELRYLQLAGMGISELPESLLALRNLAVLGLEETDLDRPPPWIARLRSLRALYLGGLFTEELPDWIGSLSGLTELSVNSCGLSTLPAWFSELRGLRRLWMRDNSLTEVPEALRRLNRLETLDISANRIEHLPDWIGGLQALRALNLSENRLSALPDRLGDLAGVQALLVSDNRLTEVPEAVARLSRLGRLELSGNELVRAPDLLGRLPRIRRLKLEGCSLAELPESLRALSNLCSLWVGNNRLTALPDWIVERGGLKSLIASGNQLTALPEGLGRLRNLESLYLAQNRLAQIPEVVWSLPSLLNLGLSDNELRSLPAEPPGYRRVGFLYLDGNKLTSIPDWVGSLPRLKRVTFSNNEIAEIPESFRGHPRLDTFSIEGNLCEELPDWLGELPSMSDLGFGSPALTEVPGWVRRLTRLTGLWIGYSAVTELPEWLGELRELEFVGLYKTPVRHLPDSMAQLHRLRFLNLNATALTELPEWIGALTRLTMLAAGENELEHVPDSIGSLSRLETLYLSQSHVTRLPESVVELRALKNLRVADSRLHTLPSTLGRLKRLQKLELQDNLLTELPTDLLDLPLLDELKVHGNPLLSPPPEFATEGTTAVLDFLAARKEGSARQWESKLLVVGEGGVGKTSMIRRLLGDGFDPGESTTHGMRTYEYARPHPSRDGVTTTLNVWDFGGQEIYHATHQFFLTDRSLFVLLWNGRLGWEQGRLRYWLDIIKARAPQSPVLLVATHSPADGRPADLPFEDLRRNYPQVVDNLAIDNETGDGLPPLAESIDATAAGLPLMGTEWPLSWLNAAEAVRRLPETHVTPARLFRTMAEAGLRDPRHQGYVAAALHTLGTILYHAADPELRDTVILRPEWVNEYISRVLDDPEVERCHGLLRRSRLDELWGELDRGMRDHFLAMMDKYDLSYKTGTGEHGEDVSLVVERLSWQAVDCREQWDRAADTEEPEHEIRVVYELSTMPPGIPTWFIARSHRFSTNTHWRTGALLAHPDGRHRALIRSDRDRGRVELAVRGPAPAGFFALLDDGLNLTLERYPGLSITCMVPCPCRAGCPEYYDYRDLQRRMTRKKPLLEIECRKSNEMVYVPLLLLGLPPSDRDDIRAALTRIAGQNLALDGRLTELVGDQQRMFLKLQQQIHSGLETKCPSVFTLVTARQAGRVTRGEYELHLYCEEPGQWHPLRDEAGVYRIAGFPDWAARMAPHLRTVLGLLKHAAPLASPALGATFAQLDARLKADVEMMAAIVEQFSDVDTAFRGRPELTGPGDGIGGGPGAPAPPARPSNEADFRALENLLAELDPKRGWGGLSRVTTPEGLVLYLCPEHADSYKP